MRFSRFSRIRAAVVAAVTLAGAAVAVDAVAATVPQPAVNAAAATTITNPPLWQDFADDDIIRVGDTYYDSASTMHYSPGAPILRSYDMVNWEVAGHSVPSLDFDSNAYNLNGGRASSSSGTSARRPDPLATGLRYGVLAAEGCDPLSAEDSSHGAGSGRGARGRRQRR